MSVIVNGHTMEVPAGFDWVKQDLERYGHWEKRTSDFIRRKLKPGMTFLDVGAQIGYYTLLASDLVGSEGKVYAAEPSSSNLAMLRKNVEGIGNVEVLPYALGDVDGTAQLSIDKTAGEHSLTKRGSSWEDVPVRRWVGKFPDLVPDIVKIDVEGFERQVLLGMPIVTGADGQRPTYLIIEDWYNHIADWLIDEHGWRLVTTDRAYGIRILTKGGDDAFEPEPLRCHLLGVFNTPTTIGPAGVGNAFGTKVVKMARILKSLGHHVIFYGVEGSEVECDEFVQVSTLAILEEAYGKRSSDVTYGCTWGDVAHRTFNANAIAEIKKRHLIGDFLLCCHGSYQKEIADAVNIPETVEIGIGYTGSFAKFRIFESYFQMHWSYGAEGIGDGRLYDCVIPGFFDPADFEYREEKGEYYLYLGRVVTRKGVEVAVEACKRIGKKLVVAGFGMTVAENRVDGEFFERIKNDPNVEFVGFADREKRRELMAGAKALFMPTLYLEPFGYVAIEAMFSGTPVITTDHGAFNETVLHGRTGFRCRTLEQFVWAAENAGKIRPADCRMWAEENYSMDRAAKMYKEYFEQILGLYGKGWYRDNPGRTELDWLRREYV